MQTFFIDTREYVPDTTFDLIPNGTYTAMIVEAKEMTSKTTGQVYGSLKVEIVDGPFKGRKIYDNLFTNSTNATAQSIAQRKLNDIANAVGQVVVKGAEDLTFKPLSVTIGVSKEGKNEVKRYMSKNAESFVSKRTAPINDSVPF